MENSLLDMLRKRQKDAEDEATVTAVSSLVGSALSGDASQPVSDYGISQSQKLMDRKRSLENQETSVLMSELKAKNTPSSSRRFQFVPMEDEQGNQIWGRGDRSTGGLEPTSFVRGLSPFIGVDPREGELARVNKAKGGAAAQLVPSASGKQTPFSVKDEKDILEGQKSLRQNKTFSNAKAGVVSSNQIISLLNTREPINDSGVGTLFLRAFGEVGALSDRERAQFFGSPALMRRFDRLIEKADKGILGDEDRQDMLDTAMQLRQLNLDVLKQEVDSAAKLVGRRTGLSEEKVKPTLEPLSDVPQQRAKQFAPSRGLDTFTRIYKGRRYRFTKNPKTGKYDGVLDD